MTKANIKKILRDAANVEIPTQLDEKMALLLGQDVQDEKTFKTRRTARFSSLSFYAMGSIAAVLVLYNSFWSDIENAAIYKIPQNNITKEIFCPTVDLGSDFLRKNDLVFVKIIAPENEKPAFDQPIDGAVTSLKGV